MEVKLGAVAVSANNATFKLCGKKQFELILKQPLISVLHLNMSRCLKELKHHFVMQTKFFKLLYNRF